MTRSPRLVLQSDPSKVARLDPATPLTIGRATNNRLSLPQETLVSDHHAVVRFSTDKGWLICDWNSETGTFLNGEPLQHCRQLRDGAAIGLGPRGPVLIFQDADPVPGNAASAPASTPAPPTVAGPTPGASNRARANQAAARPVIRAATAAPGAPESIDFAGERLALDQILSVTVHSEPHHPHIFSWWLLLCLGSLLLLPFPLLFWILELGGLAGWVLLGARKNHSLVVVLRNGLAYRRSFANRPTALSHRNGIRRALGQGADDDGPMSKAR